MHTSVKNVKASKSSKKSSTQTTISRFFTSGNDKSQPSDPSGIKRQDGRHEGRGKKRLSDAGMSSEKRPKLSLGVEEEGDEKCTVTPSTLDKTVCSKASVSHATLARLKDFSCHGSSESRVSDQVIKMEVEPSDSAKAECFAPQQHSVINSYNELEEEVREEPNKIKQEISFVQFAKNTVIKKSSEEPGVPNRRTKTIYTPLEEQFMEIKKQHADTVLCVECGYKYRFFGEDAEIAAKELNITCHLDHNFMMASIPTHRLFVHVRRLVSQGYKVGVVKQTETTAIKASGANKSSLFTRQLHALYTKSTLVGEDVNPLLKLGDLEQAEDVVQDSGNNYLMCVSESFDKQSKELTVGMVVVQPSIGDLMVDCFKDNVSHSELESRVLKIQPVEILVPSDLSEATERLLRSIALSSVQADDRIRIEKRESSMFEYPAAMRIIRDFYRDTPHPAVGNQEKGSYSLCMGLESPIICCLGPVIQYLTEFKLEKILLCSSSFKRLSSDTDHMQLSAATMKNLEILCNQTTGSVKGSLLWVLDHTQTPFGKRLLRKWVSQPLKSVIDIQARQEAVAEMLSSESSVLPSLQSLLTRLPDLERGLCSIYHKKCSTQEFYLITSTLSRLSAELQALMPAIQSQLSSALLKNLLLDTPQLLSPAQNFLKVLDEKAAKTGNKTEMFVDLTDFPVIRTRKEEIQSVLSDIMEHRREIRLVLKNPSLDYTTVSGQQFLIEVKNSMSSIVPADWVKINSTKIVGRYHTPFIVEKHRRLQTLREQLVIDCNHEWINFLQLFGDHYYILRKAVCHLATMDCLFSLAQVAKENNYCRPEILEDKSQILIMAGKHPVITSLMGVEDQYVPNDTHLQGDGKRAMIITGPNMGGKSSYIRQVALVTIMAQLGSFVPAREASVGIIDAIYVRMGASDNISRGRSTFMEELVEASDILARATCRSLVILDELGRGTSTHDGIAIAYATLESFIRDVRCMTLFVTHYPPLCELEHLYPQHVGNYHMAFLLNEPESTSDEEEVQPEFITFLYQLTEGAAARSYGLNVARLAEIPESILRTAALKSKELEALVNCRRKMVRLLSDAWSITNKEALLDWRKCSL
ncbi:DNA mismatch repair protein Msh3 isoform X1 [Carassius auratus]|uniref:DNA mismatch repair protein n=1 Tax=Carassius auratus TaxID=7957 RepID=A0A6P6K6B3_CARAU|nr:DNA mismatch repair protein Msh3 isoform X1 [Carassius auratus]